MPITLTNSCSPSSTSCILCHTTQRKIAPFLRSLTTVSTVVSAGIFSWTTSRAWPTHLKFRGRYWFALIVFGWALRKSKYKAKWLNRDKINQGTINTSQRHSIPLYSRFRDNAWWIKEEYGKTVKYWMKITTHSRY